jgi:hypothetical protein
VGRTCRRQPLAYALSSWLEPAQRWHPDGTYTWAQAAQLAQPTKPCLELPCRDHDWRLTDDPVLAVDQLTKLGQGLRAVAGAGLGDGLLGRLRSQLGPLAFFPFGFRGVGRGLGDRGQDLVFV